MVLRRNMLVPVHVFGDSTLASTQAWTGPQLNQMQLPGANTEIKDVPELSVVPIHIGHCTCNIVATLATNEQIKPQLRTSCDHKSQASTSCDYDSQASAGGKRMLSSKVPNNAKRCKRSTTNHSMTSRVSSVGQEASFQDIPVRPCKLNDIDTTWSSSRPLLAQRSRDVLCYLCSTPKRPGKLDVNKAKALGIKVGLDLHK